MENITSLANSRVVNIARMVKQSRARLETGLYIVEGLRMVREVPADDLESIYFTQYFFNNNVLRDERLIRLVDSAEKNSACFIVSDQCMRKMADTENPQGILAVVKQKNNTLTDLIGDGSVAPLIVIAERLQDPGNMGTIIRMSEGAGVTGILVSSDSVDIYNPKTVRSTMGSIFREKVVVSDDLIRDVGFLKQAGIKVFGTHLDGEMMYDRDFTGPSAFLIGNEGSGLSKELSKMSDELIRIPMQGQVESLNAAVSATVVCYEAARQRR